MKKFCFDLDGTIFCGESLSYIAKTFGLWDEYADKVKDKYNIVYKTDLQSDKEYKNNLLDRIHILKTIPIIRIVGALKNFPVNQQIVDFIRRYPQHCAVITSNLDCWVSPFLESLGCEYHLTKTTIRSGRIQSVDFILDKASVVELYRHKGFEVVYIGDGINDMEAMNTADISIGFLASEKAYKGLEKVCDYCCYDQKELIELLHELF